MKIICKINQFLHTSLEFEKNFLNFILAIFNLEYSEHLVNISLCIRRNFQMSQHNTSFENSIVKMTKKNVLLTFITFGGNQDKTGDPRIFSFKGCYEASTNSLAFTISLSLAVSKANCLCLFCYILNKMIDKCWIFLIH